MLRASDPSSLMGTIRAPTLTTSRNYCRAKQLKTGKALTIVPECSFSASLTIISGLPLIGFSPHPKYISERYPNFLYP